jgi:hypothetical protein
LAASLNYRWVPYALCAALADLTAAATADKTGLQRQLGSLRESCRNLGGWVETAEGRAQGRSRDGDDRAAQDRAGGEPLDAVGD